MRRKWISRNQTGAHRLERDENSDIHKIWSMDFLQESLYDGSKFRILSVVDNLAKNA